MYYFQKLDFFYTLKSIGSKPFSIDYKKFLSIGKTTINHLNKPHMTKIINCKEVGFDCDGVIHAETEEEALAMAAEHAQKVHGLKEMSPEVVAKVRSVIHDDPAMGNPG